MATRWNFVQFYLQRRILRSFWGAFSRCCTTQEVCCYQRVIMILLWLNHEVFFHSGDQRRTWNEAIFDYYLRQEPFVLHFWADLFYVALFVAFMCGSADIWISRRFCWNPFERAPYKSRRQRRSCDTWPDADIYLPWFPSLLYPSEILSRQPGSDNVVLALLYWVSMNGNTF